MRRRTLTAIMAGAMILSSIAPAAARPTSSYEVEATLAGAAAGTVSVDFIEAGVTELTMSRRCSEAGVVQTWSSTAVLDSEVSFDKRLSNVGVSAVFSTTHIGCDGTVSDGVEVAVAFEDGQRAGKTDRSRTDDGRYLSTPIAVTVLVHGSSFGVMGAFNETITK